MRSRMGMLIKVTSYRWLICMNNIYEEFKQLLDCSQTNERDVHAFLKQYQRVIIDVFNISGNYYICVPEFRFGNDFRADFLVLSADSGKWNAAFVELEGPHDAIMLKDETPSSRLRTAQKQISQWEDYFTNHTATVRHDIAKILKGRDDVPAFNKLARQNTSAFIELANPETWIKRNYHIVIGRRSGRYSDNTNEPCPGFGYGEQVVTYDRLLDKVKEIQYHPYISDAKSYLQWSDIDKRLS